MVSFAGMVSKDRGQDISGLLAAWSDGDVEALNHVISMVYPEMRRIARLQLKAHPAGQSLQSAALVNEAYLKLVRSKGIPCENRLHFFAVCSQIIRHILVDHARNRLRAKRGGQATQISLDEALLGTRARGIEILDLDRALSALSEFDPRKGRVVELRFFGGLSVEDIAKVLDISPETISRDWRMAKTWLFSELSATRKIPPKVMDNAQTSCEIAEKSVSTRPPS